MQAIDCKGVFCPPSERLQRFVATFRGNCDVSLQCRACADLLKDGARRPPTGVRAHPLPAQRSRPTGDPVTTEQVATPPAPGNKVLIVEDSRAIASLLAASIGAVEGLQPLVAETLAQTRELLAAHAGELFVAVLDLNLPDAPDGEVVALVQAHEIPVIILTGSADPERRKALFRQNIADYISKSYMGGVGNVARLVERLWWHRDHRILVVDDSAAQRDYLCTLLHNHGYRTFQARDGLEGLSMLRAHPEIRLVLTDHQMPRMTGLQMVEQLRRVRSADELAVIALSGAEEEGLLPRFLKSGANDFLSKPFEIEELYCRIDQNLDMLHYIAEARDAASRDYLTRLYNRRYFFEHARLLHARARRGELRLALAMLDADHFKRINDSHGHELGDQALKAMAGVLQSFSGSQGFPARFGGEEFVCVQVLEPEQDPAVCLESLRAAIEAIELYAEDGSRVPLTVSIGATLTSGDSIDEMLRLADAAVYRAKQQGRNRVVILDAPDSDAGDAAEAAAR